MTEHDSGFEAHTTPEQAQVVLSEVDRITTDVTPIAGLKGLKNHSATNKIRWHEGNLFIRYPDGEANVDDSDVINLATVAWDDEDGSRTSYTVELTLDGMRLSKHIYPPSTGQVAKRAAQTAEAVQVGDYASVAANALADLVVVRQEQAARVAERELGLHIATSSDAVSLIERLQGISPAPVRSR